MICTIIDCWREDFHSDQLQEVGTMLFGHYKCDVRFRVPLIAHFSIFVPVRSVVSATVMTLRYILYLLSMCIVRGFYLQV